MTLHPFVRRCVLAGAAALPSLATLAQTVPAAAAVSASAPTRNDWARGAAACRLHPDYPPAALRAQATGGTLLHLHLDADDNIVEVHLLRPSGPTREHGLMDSAAVAAAEQCHRFQRAPETPARDQWATLEFRWELEGAGPSRANGSELAALREAAQQGDARAALQFYLRAPYVPMWADESVQWLRVAADKGDPFAQQELGRLYSVGEGVPLDLAQTIAWWERANANHNTRVTVPLATLLLDPAAPQRDPKRAMELLEQAAANHSAPAMLMLGDVASTGSAGTQDDRTAVHWWHRAESAPAYVRLGDAFAAGRGVKPDPIVAASYYQMAGKLNEPTAAAKLAALKVDDKSLAKARALADRWWMSGRVTMPEE